MEAVLAQGLSTIANLLLKAHFKPGTKEFEPKDFLVDWSGELKEEEERKQSVEEMKRFMLGFAKKQNEQVAQKQLKKQRK
jgi:hypothetical protein